MAATRIGTLRPEDRSALFQTSKKLGLDPYQFVSLLKLESDLNPNRWGGAGGGYYGLIQFGGPERKEAGLDPSKIGKYTIAEQLPHVEKWMLGRGFKPGTGIDKAYATVLGGNPNVSLNAKDSFGTSVAGSLPRFKPGGDLYKRAQSTLGDPINGIVTAPSSTQIPQQQVPSGGNTFIIYKNPEVDSPNFLENFANAIKLQALTKKDQPISTGFNPMSLLTAALNPKVNYGDQPDSLA